MKRLALLIFSILIMYVIYTDLAKGTLSLITRDRHVYIEQQMPKEENYFEKVVNHGDTVLSIVETSLNASIPVSIEQVVSDFERLNEGIRPEQIQYGKTYKFPKYQTKQTTP